MKIIKFSMVILSVFLVLSCGAEKQKGLFIQSALTTEDKETCKFDVSKPVFIPHGDLFTNIIKVKDETNDKKTLDNLFYDAYFLVENKLGLVKNEEGATETIQTLDVVVESANIKITLYQALGKSNVVAKDSKSLKVVNLNISEQMFIVPAGNKSIVWLQLISKEVFEAAGISNVSDIASLTGATANIELNGKTKSGKKVNSQNFSFEILFHHNLACESTKLSSTQKCRIGVDFAPICEDEQSGSGG